MTANRAMTVTGVSSAAGVVDVAGVSGQRVPNSGAGYQGSTGVPGTTVLGRHNQVFSVGRHSRRRTLAAGQSFTIPVTFAPRTAGTAVANLTLTTTSGSRTLSLTGYGTAPGLLLSAPPVSFGVLDTGAGGKTLTFTVSNSWDRPETITALDVPAAPFVVKGLPAVGTVLRPQQSVTASVAYDPITAADDRAFVTIASNHGSVSVPLVGAAVTGTAVLSLTPTTDQLRFGAGRPHRHTHLPHHQHGQHPAHHFAGGRTIGGVLDVATVARRHHLGSANGRLPVSDLRTDQFRRLLR